MAVWSTVGIAAVVETDRFDGDYFEPDDLEAIRKISSKGGRKLGSIADILTGQTPSDYNDEGSLTVVRSGDLVAPLIYPMCGRPFLKASPSHDRVQLNQGDILISSIGMGSIGKISLVVDPTSLITVSEVTVLRNARVPPEFLFVYLASPTGQSQIEREVTGATGQQHLLKSKVAQILVPAVPDGIEPALRKAVQEAYQRQESGRIAYAEAESLLESALGLDKLDLTPHLFYERAYSDMQAAGRYDAEYFQPPKKAVLVAIARMPGHALGEQYRSIRQLWQPEKAGAFDQVRNFDLTDALQPFLDETVDATTRESIASTKKKLKPGDLVVSRLRSYLKEIAVVLDAGPIPMVGSTEFIVLRPRKDAVRVEALLVYLRCNYIQTVLKWCQDGSNHPRFHESELLGLRIPEVVRNHQDEIVEKVQASIQARRDARRLLDQAKAIVERAILEEKGS